MADHAHAVRPSVQREGEGRAAVQRRAAQPLSDTAAMLNAAAPVAAQRALAGRLAVPVQRAANRTGLPDALKAGVESLSGIAMDDVRVHRNSSAPAQLNAHAYAQGSDIHLAPGQDHHLPHEAWHVVQQKQGRVKATMQLKAGVPVNDDAGLEAEADVMGARAMVSGAEAHIGPLTNDRAPTHIYQAKLWLDGTSIDKLGQRVKREILRHIGKNDYAKEEAWIYVQGLIDDGEKHWYTAAGLADRLIEEEHIGLKETKSRGHTSVHVHNPIREGGVFSSQTQNAIPVAKGEHRRHVIGRHTLGQATQRSTDDNGAIISFLDRHGVKKSAKTKRSDLLVAAYRMLQDHQGNLWPGHGGENSAIGFFTGELYYWLDHLLAEGTVKEDAAKEQLNKIATFSYAMPHMNVLKGQIAHEMRADGDGNLIIDDKFVDYVNDVAVNCEIDLPDMEGMSGFNNVALQLFESFKVSKTIFTDGTADRFMALDLHKPPPPLRPTAKIQAPVPDTHSMHEQISPGDGMEKEKMEVEQLQHGATGGDTSHNAVIDPGELTDKDLDLWLNLIDHGSLGQVEHDRPGHDDITGQLTDEDLQLWFRHIDKQDKRERTLVGVSPINKRKKLDRIKEKRQKKREENRSPY